MKSHIKLKEAEELLEQVKNSDNMQDYIKELKALTLNNFGCFYKKL